MPPILSEIPKISNPYPNVDIASGALLQSVGFRKPDYYTTFFGWSRVAGITAQILDERGARGGRGTQHTGQSTYREINQSGGSSHRVPLSLPVPLCPIKRGTSHGIVVADARSSKSSTEVCHFHFFLYLNITSLLSASEISCHGWRSPSISGIVPGRMHLLDPSVFVRFGSILSEMQESPTSSNLGSNLRGAGQT